MNQLAIWFTEVRPVVTLLIAFAFVGVPLWLLHGYTKKQTLAQARNRKQELSARTREAVSKNPRRTPLR